ncbi:glycoside hydrolase family 9 protein [Segetibacter koreensis]|uniref:glycoside hydrolase family 9 protein n=1 Tax=Segetibacter koreensis TaxID=398037 RepID=UPI000361492B|nr:glycoside hydrolase family 9 protein [Segetibacter koreensis]
MQTYKKVFVRISSFPPSWCKLLAIILFITNIAKAQNVTDRIKVNQLGYYSNAPKIAVVTGSTDAQTFYITSTNLRDTLFTGRLSEEKQSANSSTKTKIADFSSLQKKGIFVVLIPGVGHSYVFDIANNVNQIAAVAGLKGYYYQRVSMPLEEKYAGKWHRSAGHPDTAVYIHPSAASTQRPAGTKISTPGGWYDAGDYNKYVVNSGITMGTMFSAYEDFSKYFDTLKTNIPESNDAVPDILNELIYNLRWMLTMQDPNDGGVYNKCTNAAFDGMVMPGITTAPRYVVQKGVAATLDLAAVAAQASRILGKYQKQLPGLADSCLTASIKAWQWAEKNAAMEYDQDAITKKYEPKITTGAYGDKTFSDEWAWAAAELFVTTKNKTYYDFFTKQKKDNLSLPSWGNVEMLADYTLLRFKDKLPAFAQKDVQSIKQQLTQMADKYISNVPANAFQTVMGQTPKDFHWGSNSDAANQGIVLINAYFLTKHKKYIDNALTNLDYLLGRNATGYSFLSGVGSKSIMHPHHRQSVADGVTDPVPGLLSGGPNPAKQDKCQYEFSEPETTFADLDCSYASNEIAINWNAPFVYLANAIEALQQEVKYSSK